MVNLQRIAKALKYYNEGTSMRGLSQLLLSSKEAKVVIEAILSIEQMDIITFVTYRMKKKVEINSAAVYRSNLYQAIQAKINNELWKRRQERWKNYVKINEEQNNEVK